MGFLVSFEVFQFESNSSSFYNVTTQNALSDFKFNQNHCKNRVHMVREKYKKNNMYPPNYTGELECPIS